MQQKKNIKLLIIWISLLTVTAVVSIYSPDTNRLDIDKSHFSLKEKVNDIDKIAINSFSSNIVLQKAGRRWSLNKDYTADPTKINDLLGILSEATVRRKAASEVQKLLETQESKKYKVTLHSDEQLISSFEVAENDEGTLTYFMDDIAYVVNIPGYNYHIADIFTLSASDWRSPFVFVSNWTTLDKMSINFSGDPDKSFEIIYDKMSYVIPSISQLDTVSMYEYMEQVSFLQVQSYLPTLDSISRAPDLNITVVDVGDQKMILDFYIYKNQTLGLINNQEWAIFDPSQVNSLLKSSDDFTLVQKP